MACKDGKKKKKKLRSLTIKEISGVDRPAVEPGIVDVILKRADDDEVELEADREEIVKNMGTAALTTAVNRHTHLLDVALSAGHTTWDGDREDEHTHPFVVTTDGQVKIGETHGHSHEVEAITKAAVAGGGSTETETEANMAEKTEKSAGSDEQAAENEALKKELAISKAYGALTDAEKTHYDALDEPGREAFLAKSADERQAVIDDLAKEDEIVYKGKDGVEYRAGDDPKTIALAKRLDEQVEKTDKERSERYETDIRKRAETELAAMPGDLSAKVALLKAADSIPDEADRKAAHEALRAQNAQMAKAMETVGATGSGTDVDSAEAELNTLAKALEAKEGINYFDAYDRVSKENPSLVNKALSGH